MANTNYVLIDQIGAIDNGKEVYGDLFKTYKKGSKEVWTMKKLCKAYSPYCKEITDKMKYYHRYNRTPEMVILLCEEITSKVEFIQNIWETREIKVKIVTTKETATKANHISIYRRAAIIWAEALGWSFSAPLVRYYKDIPVDMYTKRHVTEDEAKASYGAKRTTTPQKFVDAFIDVAPESECIAFFEHYKWLFQNNLLSESLEPDWVLCPTCGRPVRNGSECRWCDTPTNQHFNINGYDFETDEFKHIKDFDIDRLITVTNYYNIEEPTTRYFDDSYKDPDEQE